MSVINKVTVAGTTYDIQDTAATAEVADLKNHIEEITEVKQPTNYAVASEDYLWGIQSDMTVTFTDSGNVTFEYPYASGNKANFGLWFDGIENGKTYVASFDLISGGLASISQIMVASISPSKGFSDSLGTFSVYGTKYTCEFTASITGATPYNGLRLSMIRATSTTVTIGNLSVIEKGDSAETVVKNSALFDIPESVLSEDVAKKLNDKTVAYSDTNLFDKSNITHGYVYPSDGTVHATGSAFAVTDFISVEPGKYYYFNNVLYGYFAFYTTNAESGYLSGENYHDERVNWYLQVPTGASYARFTVKENELSTTWINTINKVPIDNNVYVLDQNVLAQHDYPANPCDYNGTEISIFKKILCIGDSLTSGVCNYTEGGSPVANVAFLDYAYPKYLQKLSGVETTNMGLAGLTTAQWYSAKSEADLSGYDMAIIQLGVNDALYNRGWTQEEETALGNIVTKLKTENTGIKIFIATIIPAFSYSGTIFDSVSNGIREFVETANDPDIMLVDLAEYAHTKEYVAYNNGHLTGYGYLTLARDYKAYISHVIANNKELFRFVQFIGTNHQP